MLGRIMFASAVRYAGRRAMLQPSCAQAHRSLVRGAATASAEQMSQQQRLLKQMRERARAGKEEAVVHKLEQLRELDGATAVLENPEVGKALGMLIRRVVQNRRHTAIRRTLLSLMEKDLLPVSNATDALRVAVSHAAMVPKVFEWLQRKGETPLFQQYMIAANALLDSNKLNEVLVLVVDMLRSGVPPPVVLFEAVLDACAKSNQANVAVQVLELMELARGRPPPSRAFESAVGACVGAQDYQEALRLCNRAAELRVPQFHMEAHCYVQLGQMDEALASVSRAYEMGIDLPAETYESVLKALVNEGDKEGLHRLIQQAMQVATAPADRATQLLLLLSGIEHAPFCSEVILELQRQGYQPSKEHYFAMFGLRDSDPSLEVRYMEKLFNEGKLVDRIHLIASVVAAAPEIVEHLPRYTEALLHNPSFQQFKTVHVEAERDAVGIESVTNLCVQALTRPDVPEHVIEGQLAQLQLQLDATTFEHVKLAVAIHQLPCSEALTALRESLSGPHTMVTSLHINHIVNVARNGSEAEIQETLQFVQDAIAKESGVQLDATSALNAAELFAQQGKFEEVRRLVDEAHKSGTITRALLRVGIAAAGKAGKGEDLAAFANQMVENYNVSPQTLNEIQYELLERWSYARALAFAGKAIDLGYAVHAEHISAAISGLSAQQSYEPVIRFWQHYQQHIQPFTNSQTFASILSCVWKSSNTSDPKAVIDLFEQFYGTPSVVSSTPGLAAWKVYVTAVRNATKQRSAVLARVQDVLQQMARSRKLDWPEIMDVEAARALHECKLTDLAAQLLENAPASSNGAPNKFYRQSPIEGLKVRVGHLQAMQRSDLAVSLLASELASVKDWQANKLQKLSNELRWAVEYCENNGRRQEAGRFSALLRAIEAKAKQSDAKS